MNNKKEELLNITNDSALNDLGTSSNNDNEFEITSLDEPIGGMVANCDKLNVRKSPDISSEPISILDVDSTVLICGKENGFYKIVTGSGIEGYCKEEFIERV